MPDPPDNQRDFFISFNKNDREWASWIAFELEAAGHSVYFQDWDFQPGNNFILKMHEAARQTRATVAVLSPSFLKSEFAASEWAAALVQDPTGAQRRLIGARVRPCKPDGLLAALVYIDLVGLNEEAAAEALRNIVSEDRPKPKSVGFPGVPRKRFPGALPTRWNVGPRNPNYLDRDNLIARLHDALSSGTAAALTQAIAGLGGVGKSTLAREYAHTLAGEYDTVWEVRAETSATLVTDMASLAREVQVAELGMQEPDAAKAALAWLRGQQRWLLIFDNAVNPEDVKPWLPGGTTGRVVITSRNPNWRGVCHVLEVEVFSPDDGAKFLVDRTGITTEPPAARRLSEVLGGLPLALDLAGTYIDEKRTTIAKYLELLPKYSGRLLAPVAGAFRISLQELSSVSLRLLQQLSFLAPDDVPRSLLIGDDELEFDEALAGLIRYSLVEVAGDGLFTHRLLQSSIRDALTDQTEILKALADRLNVAFGYEEHLLSTWANTTRLYPHVAALIGHAAEQALEIAALAVLSNEASRYALDVASDLPAALILARRALEIDEKVYGPVHPEVATDLNNIGSILQIQGDLAGASECTRRALEIDENFYGPDHPNVAIRASNLGSILKDQGDLAGALKYTLRALSIDEKCCGPEHPNVAIRASNIGQILQAQADLAGALGYSRRALAIDEKSYGPAHPEVATDANNIGQILRAQGDLARALEYGRRALSIDEKVYGPDHPKVARDASGIGTILRDLGDLNSALEHARRALGIDEKVYGSEHPSVARDANNIGTILRACGDLTGALECARRALAIDEKFYGQEHPDVATDANSLGQILHDHGDLVGSLEYTRRALAIRQKFLGPDHPSTRSSAENLAAIEGQRKAAGA